MSEVREEKRDTLRKKRKRKKDKIKLPRKIIPLPNADKSSFTEYWTDYQDRDPLDLPKPFRCILSGPPSSGKSTVIKNMLARCEFHEIYVVHVDPETTAEYNDIKLTYFGKELPELSLLRGARDIKKCLIIEDMDLSQMSKSERTVLDRLFGNVSSHDNVSIFFTAQDPIQVPLCARRTANCFIIYKQPDLVALSMMGSRTGYDQKKFAHLFKHIKTPHDFLMIDLTRSTPYPLRLNAYIMLDPDSGEVIS